MIQNYCNELAVGLRDLPSEPVVCLISFVVWTVLRTDQPLLVAHAESLGEVLMKWITLRLVSFREEVLNELYNFSYSKAIGIEHLKADNLLLDTQMQAICKRPRILQ